MNERIVQAIRRNRQKIFLDSGAFTMHRKKKWVSMVEYANFISEHADIIDVASNLDVIGPDNEQQSYDRFKRLQQLLEFDGLSHLVRPVHHLLDRNYWLERYLDEGHDYILLGGTVHQSPKLVRTWLDRMFGKYLSTPRVRVHGFGLGSGELVTSYPWYSVDSTTWWQASRFSSMWMDIALEDGSIADVKIDFSERSPRQDVANSWHYYSLHPADRKRVTDALNNWRQNGSMAPSWRQIFKAELGCKMGFNPAALGRSYGLRDLGCIEYYRRMMWRNT